MIHMACKILKERLSFSLKREKPKRHTVEHIVHLPTFQYQIWSSVLPLRCGDPNGLSQITKTFNKDTLFAGYSTGYDQSKDTGATHRFFADAGFQVFEKGTMNVRAEVSPLFWLGLLNQWAYEIASVEQTYIYWAFSTFDSVMGQKHHIIK